MKSISDLICDLGSGRCTIRISTGIYSLEALHAASYEFTDSYHILIIPDVDDAVTVLFEAKDEDRDTAADLKEFMNALIDHQVRCQLDKANGKIRDLIVAHAFSPFDLQKETDPL